MKTKKLYSALLSLIVICSVFGAFSSNSSISVNSADSQNPPNPDGAFVSINPDDPSYGNPKIAFSADYDALIEEYPVVYIEEDD
jgi:hypothetical protein